MIELAQLFQDVDQAIVEQDAAFEQIDQQGEEVHQNVSKAEVQMDSAIKHARAARKKKWICLGIISTFYLLEVRSWITRQSMLINTLQSSSSSLPSVLDLVCTSPIIHQETTRTNRLLDSHHSHKSPFCTPPLLQSFSLSTRQGRGLLRPILSPQSRTAFIPCPRDLSAFPFTTSLTNDLLEWSLYQSFWTSCHLSTYCSAHPF